MYRRIVSLILLPGLLLTQSAALGHTHDGADPAGHGLRPHIHTNPTPVRHDHRGHHNHSPGGHHHDSSDVPEPSLPEPTRDHDDDAVYLTVEAVVARPVQADDEGTSTLFWLLPQLDVASDHGKDLSEYAMRWTHSPPRMTSADCPLYIRHLSLLI